jgi:F-type H+-transporting ATPase subunit a
LLPPLGNEPMAQLARQDPRGEGQQRSRWTADSGRGFGTEADMSMQAVTAEGMGSLHHPVQFFGLTVQVDTAMSTLVTCLVLLTAAVYLRFRISVGRPGVLQVVVQTTVRAVERSVGPVVEWVRRRVVAVAITLFWFILVANWLHLIPGLSLSAPTSDINLTLALAVVVLVAVHVTAVQARGWRGYLRHYLSPWWLAPVKMLQEIIKPVTLALRLFGVIFSSAVMLLLIDDMLPPAAAVLPHALWTLFDVFVGAIQAFIFALLTVLYFRAALPSAPVAPAISMSAPGSGKGRS